MTAIDLMEELGMQPVEPEAGDTAALQGFEALDLMPELDTSLLDDSSLSSLVEADQYEGVKEPHALFDTELLSKALKPLTAIVKDRQEIVAKTVHLIPADGGMYFRVNTGEHNAQVFVETINSTNALHKEFIIEFCTFQTVIRDSGSRLLIKEHHGCPVAMIHGGEMEFENYSLDKSLYEHSAFDLKPEAMTKYEAPLFVAFLDRALRTMTLATRPEDKKIRLEEGRAFTAFLSSIAAFEGVPIDGVSFRMDYLLFLLRFLTETEFYYKELDKSFVFRTGRSVVVFPKIDTEDLARVSDTVDSFNPVLAFTVSPTQFYRVLSTIKSLIGSTGIVRLETIDSKLWVKASTKTGKGLNFPLAAAPAEATLKMSTPVGSLISTAMMMRKDSVIQVEVSAENSICFKMELLRIIFGSLMH